MSIPALIFILSFCLIVVVFVVVFLAVKKKYERFALEHSLAIKELSEINKRYKFVSIKNFDMKHSYDNENFYETISTKAYLIYQLVYIQKDLLKALNDADANDQKFAKYKEEVSKITSFGSFDTEKLPRCKKILSKTEKAVFGLNRKFPKCPFPLKVHLELTNINGKYKKSKEKRFNSKELRSLIGRINNKSGGRYNDKEIWDAICAVERGKVTNKMRFSIYARDGYRCKICGRKTNDLEIDHIYPIAKGGKSTYDNLQTLCHSCNKKKGASVEYN